MLLLALCDTEISIILYLLQSNFICFQQSDSDIKGL